MHATRRRAARRESSERARFLVQGRAVDGWTLNQSYGGIRAIVEESLELGAVIHVGVGAAEPRPGRIVWIQEEPDGAIVGIAYLDVDDEVEDPASIIPALADGPEPPNDDVASRRRAPGGTSTSGTLTRRSQN